MDLAGCGQFFAESLFDGLRWLRRVRVRVGEAGLIESVDEAVTPGEATSLPGPVVPAMPNLHSHAFQRAMAGLAEFRASPHDDFWSWRETMYGLAGRIDPAQLQAVAAQLYLEMLEAGYTQVCEFHYLHNDPRGRPYADPAETSWRLLEAGRDVGLGVTLLPVLYQQGGFDGRELDARQRRFHSDLEVFTRRLGSISKMLSGDPLHGAGVALHSLRAVSLDAIRELMPALESEGPVHVHVSEQTAEVEECLAHHGARPVELLADAVGLDRRWCLVHATHVDGEEVRGIAESGAVVGLCPTTEANLGDGLFPLADLASAGGAFGIGSDSHVSVSPVEELRWLEYGQRLRDRRRVTVARENGGSCGEWLWSRASAGGAQATGCPLGRIEEGRRADWLVLDPDSPSLVGRPAERLLDSLVFAGNRLPLKEVYVAGRRVVASGGHPRRSEVERRFGRVMAELAMGA